MSARVRGIAPGVTPLFAGKKREPKTAVYAGSFNPIHEGHMDVARAVRTLGYKVKFIPAGVAPHKDPRQFASFQDRFDMVQAAIAGEKDFEVSDIEYRLPKPSVSVQTLRHLFPGFDNLRKRVAFVIGVDALNGLAKWNEANVLAKKLLFLVAPRGEQTPIDQIEFKGKKYRLKTRMLKMEQRMLSSTIIRDKAVNGESIIGLVPVGVERILAERQPYKKTEDFSRKALMSTVARIVGK